MRPPFKSNTAGIGDDAHDVADALISAAVESRSVDFDEGYPIQRAVLVAAHALIAKLDAMETSHLAALSAIQESIDFRALHLDEGSLVALTESEKQIVYRALEAAFIAQGTASSIEEMDAALARFRMIAQL